MDTLTGLAVVVLVVHPVWWLVGGRRALGAGWWLLSGVAWLVMMFRLWDGHEFWVGWGCGAVGVLCLAEGQARARLSGTTPTGDVIE